MNPIYYIKQNDTLPSLVAQLMDSDGEIDLTGATVMLIARSGTRMITKPCVINNPLIGLISVHLDESETSHCGHYRAEFEITYIFGGEKLTVPNDGYFDIIITEDL